MGGGGPVGGNPARIHDGGAKLSSAAKGTGQRSVGIARAAGQGESGSGGSPVGAALTRFAAAYGRYTDDVAEGLTALSTLAVNGAEDLYVAGGGRQGPD